MGEAGCASPTDLINLPRGRMATSLYLTEGAKPFFHRGSSIGCLCLHGFSAAPAEIRWLADHLVAQLGWTVYVPRLAGHGTHERDIMRVRWQDWYASAMDGYEILRQQCEQVFIAGFSMGGLLTLKLASEVQADAVAVLSAPLWFDSNQVRLVQWLHPFIPMWNIEHDQALAQAILAEQQARHEPLIGRTHYQRWSTAAIGQVHQLAEVARECAPRVTAPSVLIYGERDELALPAHLTYLAQQLGSATIQTHLLPECDHVLTQNRHHRQVFQLVETFFRLHLTH